MNHKVNEPQTAAELEATRKRQEEAWYAAGYSRAQIAGFLKGWPEQFGHAPYEWTVGEPPAAA